MTPRYTAGAAGITIIVAAVAVYCFSPAPLIAGSNGIAPLEESYFVSPGEQRCQPLPSVPDGAEQVRIYAFGEGGTEADFGIEIDGASGSGSAPDPGLITMELDRPTEASRHGAFCITNTGRSELGLGGERRGGPNLASVTFLEGGESAWLRRADTMLERFGFGAAGLLDTWAVWFAGLMALGAAAIAVWWLLFREEGAWEEGN